MKPSVYAVLLSLALSPNVFSQGTSTLSGTRQKAPVTVVPPAVEKKFMIEHPNATARWKVEEGLYKAIFVNPVNNLGQITVYDELGRIVLRERELERQEFPATITEYQEKRFPGEGVMIWLSTDSTGRQRFYTRNNNTVYWFDQEGRPLRDSANNSGINGLTAPAR